MRQPSSLRWKLAGLIAGGSVIASVIAAAGFTWWDLNRFWEHTAAEVSAIGDIVSDQVGAALALGDSKAANEILASLRADPHIRDAVLYANTGGCFAEFHREAVHRCGPQPGDGIRREARAVVLVQGVRAPDERVGTLQLAAEIPTLAEVLRQYLGGAALIIALSLVVAGILAMALQSSVSAPILAIANAARRMAHTHRFDERVALHSNDEVGLLAGSFNTMLDEIERRGGELEHNHRQLEEEVTERSRVNAELLEAKERAEDAARLKSEFLANMSHEIRTPLNGITGMIALTLDRCADPEQRDQLSAAQRAAQSLTGILNDILDLSKMEAGKLAIETIDFDLHALLRDCVRIFDLPVREKNLRLRLSISPECPPCVEGDPVRLRQILINLLGNAVKFTFEGEVDLAVSVKSPGALRFEVSDTGIGIPKDKLASIFEAFTQADGSHTRRFGGTGLGLTITRRLVTLMGGGLDVESEPGRGSRFTIDLPLRTVACRTAAAEKNSPHFLELPPLHVLVAEDNAVNQKVICGMLRRQGWKFTLTENGEQAYGRFLQDEFDLILMDVQMPGVDGLEATNLIRREEAAHNRRPTPIIALTAHASQSQHQQCLAHGMDAVVTKPVDLASLLQAISEVMSGLTSTAKPIEE